MCALNPTSRHCPNCIRDIGPRLVRDLHQAAHDLTERQLHYDLLLVYVPEVQERGSGDGAGLRHVK